MQPIILKLTITSLDELNDLTDSIDSQINDMLVQLKIELDIDGDIDINSLKDVDDGTQALINRIKKLMSTSERLQKVHDSIDTAE
jgi:hypothetical protein